MPYNSFSDVNPAIKDIKPQVTLAVANKIASWAEAMVDSDDAPDNPWAAAIAQFYRLYKRSGGKWVKRNGKQSAEMTSTSEWTDDYQYDEENLQAEVADVWKKMMATNTLPATPVTATEAATVKSNAQRLIRDMQALLKDKTLPARLRKEIEDVQAELRRTWSDLENDMDIDTKTNNGEQYPENDKHSWSSSVSAVIPMSFADLQAADNARQTLSEACDLTYKLHTLITRILDSDVSNKSTAITSVVNEYLALVTETLGDITDDSNTQEASDIETVGEAVEFRDATDDETATLSESERSIAAESGRRSPVVVDFQILRPGPGNKRDNHYYPADVVARDIGVFRGADVFTTDHRESERSERTKVGVVLDVPVRLTENGSPVASVLIYDPDHAEKTRNRSDAGKLATLECSIFGSGEYRSGSIDGRQYKIITALTEGKYLELVSKAGAGGHALRLSESEQEVLMTKDEETENGGAAPARTQEAEPISTEFSESESETGNSGENATTETENNNAEAPEQITAQPTAMSEADVLSVLAESHLPKVSVERLSKSMYSDAESLAASINAEREYIKTLTGSGQPNAARPTTKTPAATTLQERNKAQDAVNKRWLGI